MPFAWTLYKMNKAKTRSIRIAAWDHAMGLLQGIAAFASQTPTEDQLKLQERLQTLCDMRVPADAVIEVAELILLARKIGRAEEADALVAGNDDPIGDLQAEARQEKLDDFIASMNPNPASKNKAQAAGDVLAERERQKQQEGWTPERDDKYIDCELARAAATYSLCTDPEQIKVCGAPVWPWPIYWWKPTTYRRNLVKAGALILAEIERLDRAAIHAQKDGHAE